MMKRLFLPLVAAFLVASLGLATPSHAGSVLVTTDVNIIAPAGTSTDEVQITYTNALLCRSPFFQAPRFL